MDTATTQAGGRTGSDQFKDAAQARKSQREGTWNFSAGPGCLPLEVLEQASLDILSIAGTGIGILEHSHRGGAFDSVLAEAVADFRRIANVPGEYEVLFLTGGATTQNFMVPANLKEQSRLADYITTGHWAEKSIEQARVYGPVHEAATSKDKKHSYIPKDEAIRYSADPAYVHFCSNNTIYGTEWHELDAKGAATWRERLPKTPANGAPIVCDMSSDIFSRPVDFSKYGLVYAGAQKNLGAAGCTIVVIHEGLLERKARELPLMLEYRTHAKDDSRHNTPPVFAIYLCGLVFKWILKQGAEAKRPPLDVLAERNQRKAKLVYDVLDASTFYKAHAHPSARSLMNLTFNLPSPELEKKFIEAAKAREMSGLAGHRSVGGVRASMYNAFPEAGCKALADFMREFEKKNG